MSGISPYDKIIRACLSGEEEVNAKKNWNYDLESRNECLRD